MNVELKDLFRLPTLRELPERVEVYFRWSLGLDNCEMYLAKPYFWIEPRTRLRNVIYGGIPPSQKASSY